MGIESLLASQIIGLAEAVDDQVASLLVAGTGITITYNDGAGTLTIASTVSPTWGSIGGTLSNQTDLQTALNAKMGGSTGATDNRILRSDGTGGATVQNSAVTIDDSGNISGLGTVGCGAITASGTVNATNVRCQGGSGIVGTRYINNSNDTWSAFEFPANQTSLTFSPGVSGLFRLEGTTGSHVAVKRSGTTLQVRLGDDSAFANISFALGFVGTYTVATLPSAAANAGALAQVTDSSVTTNGSAVSGGGSNRVVVFSNGSTWDVVVA